MGFVTAWSKSTGRRHEVPEHFLDNPVLSRDLTTTPPPEQAPETPVDEMIVDQLRQYAADHDIDLGGATRKDDIRAAITTHGTTHTSTTETPAAGENQE